MAITQEQVEHIAHLARLAIDKTDLAIYTKNLGSIFDLVSQMSAVDTANVQPMAHPMDLAQRMRLDVVTESNQREQFQAIAPLVDAGLYLVPQVIE